MNKIVLILISISFSLIGFAQKQQDKALFDEIYRQDSILFDAFNKKNIAPVAEIFDKDIEFYHDKSGLTDYKSNMVVLSTNFAKPEWNVKRRLLKETMEVYPIPNYGAMQIAKHEFCNTHDGITECGILKIAHVWKNTNGKWTLIRILSYDH